MYHKFLTAMNFYNLQQIQLFNFVTISLIIIICFLTLLYDNSPNAVSYTHLDVYKRQVLRSS